MQTPFYVDWTFWAAVLSLLAIVLSQLPPVTEWFKGPSLVVEAGPVVRVSHMAGYSNAGLALSIRNVGSKAARVTKIEMIFSRDAKELLRLPVSEFYRDHESKTAGVLFSFTIPPGSEWLHGVTAYQDIGRQADRELGKLSSDVRSQIAKKVRALGDAEQTEFFEVTTSLEEQAMALFEKNFCWTPGDYQLEFKFETEHSTPVRSHKYAFTMFESDTADLRALSQDYKYGFGIGVPHDKHARGLMLTTRKA